MPLWFTFWFAILFSSLPSAAFPQTPTDGSSSREPGTMRDQDAHVPGHDDAKQREQVQPQGATGPLETGSCGQSASTPQGDTPARMQVSPEESPSRDVPPNSR